MADFGLDVVFQKRAVDDDLRLVGGFAYVNKKNGTLLTDTQGDSIETSVLREAVHEFIKSGRTMGVMHIETAGGPVAAGEIVEMAVFGDGFTPQGMDPSLEGLWIVCKVHSDAVWQGVKKGDFGGFSIGGAGTRVKIEE